MPQLNAIFNSPTSGREKGSCRTFSSTCPRTVDGISCLKTELLHMNFVSKTLERIKNKLNKQKRCFYFANNP